MVVLSLFEVVSHLCVVIESGHFVVICSLCVVVSSIFLVVFHTFASVIILRLFAVALSPFCIS